MRTTSSLESLNSIIQKSFPQQTNIFKFIDSLRLLESIKASNLHQIHCGFISNRQLERKRTADRDRDLKIKHLTKKLMKGKISVDVFLESMSEKDVLPNIGA